MGRGTATWRAPTCACAIAGLIAAMLAATRPGAALAQTMPGPAYHDLVQGGHDRLARDLSRQLDLRSFPDRRDVEAFLERWENEAGGPASGYDWLAVARLWLRAGDPHRARLALERSRPQLPEGPYRLDRARIAFLEGDAGGARDYWLACAVADERTAIEAWLDVEVLATPAEVEAWDRFRTLPVGERDGCLFLRRFWNRRAAASASDVDRRILEHYRRLRHALEVYRRRGRVRPRFSVRLGRPANSVFDDRGLLYVRMGDPGDTAATAGGPCIEPNVSWAYRRPDGDRIYHLSSLGGADDWYVLENLAMAYRCTARDGIPSAGVSPLLIDIPPNVLYDLYSSRMGLDPDYARVANLGLNLIGDTFRARVVQALQGERDRTWSDMEYAVATVPERPGVRPAVDFALEWITFRAPRPELTRVWLNGMVDAKELSASVRDGREMYRVHLVWTLLDADETGFRRLPVTFEVPRDTAVSGDPTLFVRVPVDLEPGEYAWTLMVAADDSGEPSGADGGDPPDGGYARGRLVVRDMGGGVPLLSDVAVSPDSSGTWSPTEGVRLGPRPGHETGPDGIAFIYLEAYNLSPDGDYEARVRLESLDGTGTFDLSYPGTAAGRRGLPPGVLRVDLSDSEPGRYRMTVTVRDLATGLSTLPARTELRVVR